MDRKKEFKKGIDTMKSHQHRVQHNAGLRKARKDKMVSAKRKKTGAAEGDEVDESAPMQAKYTQEQINAIVQGIQSPDANTRRSSLKTLRKILSAAGDEDYESKTIQLVLNCPGVVDLLIQHLTSNHSENQLEAAWCITNIASGTHEQTQQILKTCPYLINFLSGHNNILIEQAVWALGNIAGDSIEFRDLLRANGVVTPLVNLLNSKIPSIVTTVAWCLSNLARGANPRVEEFINAGIATPLVKLLNTTENEEIASELCWVLTYLTAGDRQHINHLVEKGVMPALIRWVDQGSIYVATPALRSLGNILSGPNELTTLALQDPRTLPALLKKLQDQTNRSLQKETVWVISNIAGGLPEHVDALVSAGFLPVLVDMINNAKFDTKKEAAYALANMCGDKRYLPQVLSSYGTQVLNGYLSLLATPDIEVISLSLNFLEFILVNNPEQTAKQMEQLPGIEFLEALQYHSHQGVAEKATRITEQFFNEQLIDEDEVAQHNNEQQQFRF